MSQGRPKISETQQLALKREFERGTNPLQASKRAGVSATTACVYFRKFGWSGARYSRTRNFLGSQRLPGAPRYTGPVWIGKAIDGKADCPRDGGADTRSSERGG